MEKDPVLVALLELKAEMSELRAHLDRGTQLSFTFKQAAKILGRESAKTVSRMVRRGELTTVTICGSELIPRSELERVTTPKTKASATGRRAAGTELSAREEAEKARARLKTRRR